MSDEPDARSPSDLQRRIARLERRLERERSARNEAESIADRRMRELWLANRELDARVAERTADLERALEQLEMGTRGAAAFVSNLSHEMLTPLNGVSGMLELLGDRVTSETDRGYIETAQGSSLRLERLINRLIDLVELRARTVQPSPAPIAVSTLIDTADDRWRLTGLAAQKLLTFSSTTDHETVTVDQRMLLQAVDELVENAIVHALPGVVTVEFDVADGVLSVAVADQGPGFEVPELRGFAELFSSIDASPGRTSKGVGIGLGITRDIANLLGGSLTIDSTPGSATRAVLEVPVTDDS